jgi:hypothetical protein
LLPAAAAATADCTLPLPFTAGCCLWHQLLLLLLLLLLFVCLLPSAAGPAAAAAATQALLLLLSLLLLLLGFWSKVEWLPASCLCWQQPSQCLANHKERLVAEILQGSVKRQTHMSCYSS